MTNISPGGAFTAQESAELGKGAPRHLLKDQAYARLKARILQGDFGPGTFLSERQVSAWLQMSKTPIRAALEKLAGEGLIQISPQQGVIVRELSIHEVADHFEIRSALEPFVVRQVAGRLTAEQTQRLRANLHEQELSVRQRDAARNMMLDTAFHLLLCEFLGNREILRVMEQLRDKIHRVILRVFSHNPDRLAVGYEEHCRIAEAVIAGNAEPAARFIQEHLDRGKSILLSPRQR